MSVILNDDGVDSINVLINNNNNNNYNNNNYIMITTADLTRFNKIAIQGTPQMAVD